MRKVFWTQARRSDGEEVQVLLTYGGRLIVATTEEEVAQGPPGDVDDLEEITVTEWLEAQR